MKLLKDNFSDGIKRAIAVDPIEGRFQSDCRCNKDEVQGLFGDPNTQIITNLGEGATKMIVLPGWGDRICTFVLVAMYLRLITPMGLIFKGQGNVKPEELAFYEGLKNMKVLFQANSWVDGPTEVKILRIMIKPVVDRLKTVYPAAGKIFHGYLLIQDNFSAHSNQYAPHETIM